MKTSFENIGDANQESAFLTNAEGYDVARLERITPATWPDLEPGNYLTDDEWQSVIDTANIAPTMAAALCAIVDKLESGISPLPSDDFWKHARNLVADLRVTRVESRPLVTHPTEDVNLAALNQQAHGFILQPSEEANHAQAMVQAFGEHGQS